MNCAKKVEKNRDPKWINIPDPFGSPALVLSHGIFNDFFLGITKLHHYDGRKLFFQRYKLDNRFVLDYIKYTSLLVNLGATVREVKNIKTQQITRKDKIHSF